MKTSIYIIVASFYLHGYFINVVGDSEVVPSGKTKIDNDKYLKVSHQKSDAVADEGHSTEDLRDDDDDDNLGEETDPSYYSDDVNNDDDDTDDIDNGHGTDNDDNNNDDDDDYELEEAYLDGSLVEKGSNKDLPVVGWETTQRDLSRRSRSGSKRR